MALTSSQPSPAQIALGTGLLRIALRSAEPATDARVAA